MWGSARGGGEGVRVVLKMGRQNFFLSHWGNASQSINDHSFGLQFASKHIPLFGLERCCTLCVQRFS